MRQIHCPGAILLRQLSRLLQQGDNGASGIIGYDIGVRLAFCRRRKRNDCGRPVRCVNAHHPSLQCPCPALAEDFNTPLVAQFRYLGQRRREPSCVAAGQRHARAKADLRRSGGYHRCDVRLGPSHHQGTARTQGQIRTSTPLSRKRSHKVQPSRSCLRQARRCRLPLNCIGADGSFRPGDKPGSMVVSTPARRSDHD
jgi:hypothetical protein